VTAKKLGCTLRTSEICLRATIMCALRQMPSRREMRILIFADSETEVTGFISKVSAAAVVEEGC
jgi:hypothetical protein